MSDRPTIYLAGKITGSHWRNDILPLGTEDRQAWPILRGAIEGFANYLGPFPTRNHDGDGHDFTQIEHGSVVIPYKHFTAPETLDYIATNCMDRIRRTEFFFAFVDSIEDVGTIAEIGFACAENGRRPLIATDSCDYLPIWVEVWFSSHELENKMWFVRQMSRCGSVAGTAQEAWLRSEARDLIIARKARAALQDKCESPIEAALAEAIVVRPWGRNLKAQHSIGPYRADLALLDHRIVIECDGHAYHSTKEQRGHDAKRDRYLTAQGWRVIRCTGTEIHADMSKVVADIEAVVLSSERV